MRCTLPRIRAHVQAVITHDYVSYEYARGQHAWRRIRKGVSLRKLTQSDGADQHIGQAVR
jgi:hypothetical protein